MKKQRKNSNAGFSVGDLKRRCEDVSAILKVLSHPQRLMILCSLIEGEKTVGELEKSCDVSQSAMSQFLKAMRLEGLIDFRREGQFVYYRIADERLVELMTALHKIFCS